METIGKINRRIEADFHKEKGPFNNYAMAGVGAGRAGEALRKEFLDHLDLVKAKCDFGYLRFHGIFHEDMGVYLEDKNGEPIYNWQYVDMVYDALLERNIKPFVEVGFMPKLLANGTQTVFWWETNVNPPKDYDKWYALVHAFALHLEERYGRDEVNTWHFEIWNEPNIKPFFSGTREEYFKIYEISVKAIKSVCGSYRVGGPATAAGDSWISEFIQFCHENKLPVDFVSTHIYGVAGAFDEFGDSVLVLADKDLIIEQVKLVYDKVKASPIPDLPIHFTEWSSSYSSRDPVHDTYLQAPHILYNLKRMEGYVESMAYWTFTDIFEEVGPPPSPFHGGFGLINTQGLKKPSFFAHEFLGKLGGTELSQDDPDSWVCKSAQGIQVLLWQYAKPEQDAPNHVYFKRALPSSQVGTVTVNLTGIPEGSYLLEVFTTGYDKNDIYNGYLKLGSPQNLSKKQVDALKKVHGGLPSETAILTIGAGGSWTHALAINENDVYLITLTKVGGN